MSTVDHTAATDAVARNAGKPGRSRRWVGTVALSMVGLAFALLVIAVRFGGYQVRPVLSGSMRPGLAVGGVVVTHQVPLAEIKVRDVIVFHRPDNPTELVVHRIVNLKRTASTVVVRTQGDANDTRDPWTITLRGTSAYRAVFSLPLIGYPAVWMHSPDGRGELLMLAGLVLAVVAFGMWRKGRRPDSDADRESVSAEGTAAAPDAALERHPLSVDDAVETSGAEESLDLVSFGAAAGRPNLELGRPLPPLRSDD